MKAGLVLCGGRSTRMGRDKASLPFGDVSLLERVVARLDPVVDELWLVAREGQALPVDRPTARDPAEGLGPLAGLAAGLRAIRSERAFLTACDAPLLEAGFIERMFTLSEGHDIAIVQSHGHWMTTTAVYAKRCLPVIEDLLARGARRPRDLLQAVSTRVVTPDELREVDPELRSLEDCDTPEEYRRCLELAGLAPQDHPL